MLRVCLRRNWATKIWLMLPPRERWADHTQRAFLFLTLEQEIENIQNTILASEEALLEVLCFDFWVENVHEHLIDLLEEWAPPPLQDYAWSIAHDSLVTC